MSFNQSGTNLFVPSWFKRPNREVASSGGAPHFEMPMVYSLLAGSTQLNKIIAQWPSSYIKPGDIIFINTGSGTGSTSGVNSLAADIKAAFPFVEVGTRCFSRDGMINLKNNTSSNITILCYTYEAMMARPEFGGFEWDNDWNVTQDNFHTLASVMSGTNKKIWSDPTGRGLPDRENAQANVDMGLDPNYQNGDPNGGHSHQYDNWNYAVMADILADVSTGSGTILIQSQGNAEEVWNGVSPNSMQLSVDWLDMKMQEVGIMPAPLAWGVQISIATSGNGITNGAQAYTSVFEPYIGPSNCGAYHHWVANAIFDEGTDFMDLWAQDSSR